MKGSLVALTWLEGGNLAALANSASVEEERGYNCIPRGKGVWHHANTDTAILIADTPVTGRVGDDRFTLSRSHR
jgi:hypothetical protein